MGGVEAQEVFTYGNISMLTDTVHLKTKNTVRAVLGGKSEDDLSH